MIDITIVIVNFNTVDLLRNCLRCVEKETQALNCEVFVVDNGSNDGSPEMVRREFPSVNLIENGRNLGFARATNLALRQASGRAVLLLNSDAELLPASLDTLWNYLEAHPGAGAVGAQLIGADGEFQNAVDHFPTLLTELANKSLLKILFPKWYPGKRSRFTEPVEVPALIGAAMMVRREVLEKVGLLDEAFFFFMEETDWCYRMRQAGWLIAHLPQARIRHLGGATAKKFSWKSKVEYYRSRYLFFRKHRSRLSTAILAVGLLVKILVGALVTGLGTLLSAGRLEPTRQRFQQYLRLLLWHLKGCPPGIGLAPEGEAP